MGSGYDRHFLLFFIYCKSVKTTRAHFLLHINSSLFTNNMNEFES
jgi:hypothetical protein